MTTTSLKLDGAYFSTLFHKFFGSEKPKKYDYKKKGLGENFFIKKNQDIEVKGYVNTDPDVDGNPNKEYWVENHSNKVILTTALMAHGELASSAKRKQISSYQSNFNFEEIEKLVKTLQATKEYQNKPIHILIPRVETGAIEDHIVLEYREIAAKGTVHNPKRCMVIDSKPWPSGVKHDDIAERIHTEKQGFFNSEDCGYHVNLAIPALKDMIIKGSPINSKTLLSTLDKKDNKNASYATRVAIGKLHRLANLYGNRVKADINRAGDKKLHEYLFTFGIFRFGCGATAKLGATNKILNNIENKEADLFKGLSKAELEAANDSTLGKVVEEYQDSIRPPASLFSRVFRTS